MRRVIPSVITVVFGLAITLPPAFAADSCGGGCPTPPGPPKNARSVSATGVPVGLYPAPANTLVATLKSAKKKTILMVEAKMTNGPYGPILVPMVLSLAVDANGIFLEPQPVLTPFGDTFEDCGLFRADGDPDGACTVTGTWWLDIDAYAGVLLPSGPKPPLVVTLTGGDPSGAGVGTPVDISLSVSLVKK